MRTFYDIWVELSNEVDELVDIPRDQVEVRAKEVRLLLAQLVRAAK